MADTMRGDFPKVICSDCGVEGCVFKHWGPLVPSGVVGSFCWDCWDDRRATVHDKNEEPKPLGYKLQKQS